MVLLDHIISDTEVLELSKMAEKEKKWYEAFKEFHQQYLVSGGRSAELSGIIHCIRDNFYPLMPPKMAEQAMATE